MPGKLLEKVEHLIRIGIALSAERDINALLEKILLSAITLTSADGGTLYLVTSDQKLHVAISLSHSLHIRVNGLPQDQMVLKDIPLQREDGSFNEKTIVTYVANHKSVVNIEDAYNYPGFDFSGPRMFDEQHGYRTKSVLALPVINAEGEVMAVLQLINAHDAKTKKILPFSKEDESIATSFASQAGIALTNARLIIELKNLFKSFTTVIANAIDEKSPMTGNHSRRVPILCEMLAKAVNAVQTGPLKEVRFTPEEIEELKIAAFLHDCGKITTPAHIIDKHSKLETIFDRIELIQTRFEVLKRDAQIQVLEKKLKWMEHRAEEAFKAAKETFHSYDTEYEKNLAALSFEELFVEECNHSPFIDKAGAEQIKKMASRLFELKGKNVPLLNPDEVENLTIERGNLNAKERKIIENHVVLTHSMLSALDFPKNLKHVDEIASAHHERVDGKGYPQGLKGEQMLPQARILAIADIFEALSAPDRPYKQPLPLSKIYKILEEKVQEGHLDGQLVSVFLKEQVGLKYAQEHLAPAQIDVEL